MNTLRPAVVVFFFFLLFACKDEPTTKRNVFDAADLVSANSELLSIAMEDGFPPPIASRVYVYPHIAHYLTLRAFFPDSLQEINSKLDGLNTFKYPAIKGGSPELASLLSFCTVAKKVVFSEHLVDELRTQILDKAAKNGFSKTEIEESVGISDSISSQVIAWLNKDNYIETRTMDRWTSSKDPGEWRETPADYQAGLEPHWTKMRPMVIDSPGIYSPKPLPVYSPKKSSDFYKMVERVYLESKTLDSNKVATAWYWDDNPNTSEHRGHLVTIIHKFAPPGHWLNIVSGIVKKEKCSVFTASKAFTFTAIGMYDSIIACWYVKYKTNLVRPVTYIQENIDVEWKPLIQTPPFPEYTSGHSAISATAATVLGHIFGTDYSFIDSTQMLFGIGPRTYKNFDEAAWEVSLSRFYGGIHYFEGIEEGNKQGKFIGHYVTGKLE